MRRLVLLPAVAFYAVGAVFLVAFPILLVWVASVLVYEVVQVPFLPKCSFKVLEAVIQPAPPPQCGFMLSVKLQTTQSGIRFDKEVHSNDYGKLVILQRGLEPHSVVSGRIRPKSRDVVLESEVLPPVLFLLLFSPLAAIPYGMVRLGFHRITRAFSSHSESSAGKKVVAAWEIHLFGWSLIWLGVGVGVYASFSESVPIWDWVRSRHWIPAEATIELSRPVSVQYKDSVRRHPEVLYRYEWRGETHRSSRVGGMEGASDSQVAAFLARNPEGSVKTCLVNPISPGESLLERTLSFWMFREPAIALCGAALFSWFGLYILSYGRQMNS